MFYYIYQITNKINNKIYIGVHKTKSLDDGYMGSGKVLKRAIEKHGIENFEKTILEYFGTSSAMYAKEKEIVDDEFLLREDVYNLRRGGFGGFDYINSITPSIEYSRRGLIGLKSEAMAYCYTLENWGFRCVAKQNKVADMHRINKSGIFSADVRLAGSIAAQSPTARAKQKQAYKEIQHQQGNKNSSFGTMWITNDAENKKIKKTDSIPAGYRKGRLCNTKSNLESS